MHKWQFYNIPYIMQHLQPNTTLQGGKYRIERVLGQGGFGITYLARNTVLDVYVAIKEFFMKDENDRDGSSVITPNSTKTELFNGQKEKFKKEAKRMFSIKNEHIVGVLDFFEENGTAYYVMDYIDGESLYDRLHRTGQPFSEYEIRRILPQILDALQEVHAANIWHLDLKPANILLDKSGNITLIDFGASKQLNAQKGGATTDTAISYTRGYAPREQMEQSYEKFGPWTDIYALGATLYTLLTNKRPPLPTDIDDDMSEDKHLALPLPSTISAEVQHLVIRTMVTDYKKRPQSIKNVRGYLMMESQSVSSEIPPISNTTTVSSAPNIDSVPPVTNEVAQTTKLSPSTLNESQKTIIVKSKSFPQTSMQVSNSHTNHTTGKEEKGLTDYFSAFLGWLWGTLVSGTILCVLTAFLIPLIFQINIGDYINDFVFITLNYIVSGFLIYIYIIKE